MYSITLFLLGAATVLNACVGSLALSPSGVIFPLYIYPGDNCASWTQLFSSISAYPSLQFLVIVNPASGPGAPGSQPDTNYQACVAKLRTTGATHGNVKMIGYVLTGYGTRAASTVTADIDTYAGWTAAYRPEGIFLDEASTSADVLASYQTYVTHVKSKFSPSAFVTLNPGVWDASASSTGYFSIADLVVTFENTNANFASSAIPNTPSAPPSKQAVIIHTGPNQVPLATVRTLVQTLGVSATFYTDFVSGDAYSNFPTNFSVYLDALVLGQGSCA